MTALPVQVFVFLNGIPEVNNRAIKFFFCVRTLLADFPHEQFSDLIAFGLNQTNELLERLDTIDADEDGQTPRPWS